MYFFRLGAPISLRLLWCLIMFNTKREATLISSIDSFFRCSRSRGSKPREKSFVREEDCARSSEGAKFSL